MARLTLAQARRRLPRIPLWSLRGASVTREFAFASFPAAVRFVNRVARIAERRDHHPDIDLRYRTVRLTLSTHSAGGLTVKDFASAREYSTLHARLFGPR
jgi:4a-hydroxytetrahydrobiopterin dehydratase